MNFKPLEHHNCSFEHHKWKLRSVASFSGVKIPNMDGTDNRVLPSLSSVSKFQHSIIQPVSPKDSESSIGPLIGLQQEQDALILKCTDEVVKYLPDELRKDFLHSVREFRWVFIQDVFF